MRDCTRAPTPASPFSKRPISRKLIFCEEDAVYMCRSRALHKALILKGLVRRRCSVRWSHIINLRSLFLPAIFFILQTQAPFFYSPKQIRTSRRQPSSAYRLSRCTRSSASGFLNTPYLHNWMFCMGPVSC